MIFSDLQVEEWQQFDEASALRCAEEIAARLLHPVTVANLQRRHYGERDLLVAQFQYGDSLFSLVPGGRIRLGFEPDYFSPTAEQMKSFQYSAEEYRIDEDIKSYLQSVTTPPREVEIPPLLIETRAQEIGLEPVSADEPEVRQLRRQHGDNVEAYKQYRVRRLADGSVAAWRIVRKTHAEIASELSAEGLRMIASDEWEYACGAGAKTLFRWGNECPCDRYPTDNTVDEIRRKKEWVLSGGQIAFTPDEPDWNMHLRPNLFGLHIAENPYQWEVVLEEKIARGGDGGCNICGGVGFFLGWLPLATAYLDPNFNQLVGYVEDDLSNNFMRRVIPLL